MNGDHMIITQINVTPVAFKDPPLLNAAGVHEPWALRTIVEVITDEGLTGLGETYGDLGHLTKVRECAEVLIGWLVEAVLTWLQVGDADRDDEVISWATEGLRRMRAGWVDAAIPFSP